MSIIETQPPDSRRTRSLNPTTPWYEDNSSIASPAQESVKSHEGALLKLLLSHSNKQQA